ncbi:MAG TPA: P1 family peptidase [Symbiobacteriaceae bacterium]
MWQRGPYNDLTDVPGVWVGHAEDRQAMTGVTAVLTPQGAVVGIAVEGSAPGTRETDLCRPGNLVTQAHGVLLCGGSAFGLAAADGAMRYLEEHGYGFPTEYARVPIVPAAVLYDLGVGDPRVRPTAEMGYAACAAASRKAVPWGRVGAGTGCTVGKILGMKYASPSGIGSASLVVGNVVVAAAVAVNAFGDVRDPDTGRILAGARHPDGGFADTLAVMATGGPPHGFGGNPPAGQNTTIGVVAVGGELTKEGANKVARMAHDGLARTIVPIHTMYDGDTLFCLATGGEPVDVTVAGTAAALAVQLAVLDAVTRAASGG